MAKEAIFIILHLLELLAHFKANSQTLATGEPAMMKRGGVAVVQTLLLLGILVLIAHHLSHRYTWRQGYSQAKQAWISNSEYDWNFDVSDIPESDISVSFAVDGESTEQDEDQDIVTARTDDVSVTDFGIVSEFSLARVQDVDPLEEPEMEQLSSAATGTDDREILTSTQPKPSPTRSDPSLVSKAADFVEAIISTNDSDLIQLSCSDPNTTRYGYLRPDPHPKLKPRYFFALDLYQAAHILPRLLSSIVRAVRFLGTESCVISIIEGRSTDGTFETLTALSPEMKKLGPDYYLHLSDLDPLKKDVDRVQALADLRNQALVPLMNNTSAFDAETTVIFINDVSLCAEDILELLHQRVYQSADMVCAMDWIEHGQHFYDVWVSRQMNGDSFFEIPQNGEWNFAGNLFWNEPSTRKRLKEGKPFQVFSCWNGATAFTAKPLIEHKISFRSAREGECYLGEPTHFCKDMWKEGYWKIGVVPSVNIGYSDEQSVNTKALQGTVSSWVEREDSVDNRISWNAEPPQLIKCWPSWKEQSWVRWNQ